MKKALNEFFGAIWSKIREICSMIKEQWEASTILLLATIGCASLLYELPFVFALPMMVESVLYAPLVAPVLATVAITVLVYLMMNREEE